MYVRVHCTATLTWWLVDAVLSLLLRMQLLPPLLLLPDGFLALFLPEGISRMKDVRAVNHNPIRSNYDDTTATAGCARLVSQSTGGSPGRLTSSGGRVLVHFILLQSLAQCMHGVFRKVLVSALCSKSSSSAALFGDADTSIITWTPSMCKQGTLTEATVTNIQLVEAWWKE